MEKHVHTSKYDPAVEEVELMESNLNLPLLGFQMVEKLLSQPSTLLLENFR